MQNRDIIAALRDDYAEYTKKGSDSRNSEIQQYYFDGKAMGIAMAIQKLLDMSPD